MFHFDNPPGDIAANRERRHEQDLAVYGLYGAVQAIVAGAKFPTVLTEAYRLEQLASALADCEARRAKAQERYEADMAVWRATVIEEDAIPV